MSSQEKAEQRVVVFSPLDWGVVFAHAQRSTLLTFVLLPLLVQTFVVTYCFYLPVQPQHAFLLAVLVVAADALLLSSVTMFAVETIRGIPMSPQACIARAMRLLPKVLLSDLLVILSFGIALLIAPIAIILVAFVLWAPAFVVGETYAPVKKHDVDEDNDLMDDDFLEEAYYRERVKRALSFFTEKAIWDLGLARSIRFASIHFATSLHISLLFWAARLLPVSLLYMIFKGNESLPVQILQLIGVGVLHVFAAGAWAAVFLALLPEKAKEELSIPPQLDANTDLSRRLQTSFRLPGRRLLNLLLFVAALAPYIYLQRQNLAGPPAQFELELLSAEKIGEQFVVRVKLEDPSDHLRWFDPHRFNLRYLNFTLPAEPATEAQQDAARAAQRLSLFDPPAEPKDLPDEKKDRNLLAPLGYQVFRDDGQEITEPDFTPSYAPLRLSIFFKQPAGLS